jgi:hypothetical protein
VRVETEHKKGSHGSDLGYVLVEEVNGAENLRKEEWSATTSEGTGRAGSPV